MADQCQRHLALARMTARDQPGFLVDPYFEKNPEVPGGKPRLTGETSAR